MIYIHQLLYTPTNAGSLLMARLRFT